MFSFLIRFDLTQQDATLEFWISFYRHRLLTQNSVQSSISCSINMVDVVEFWISFQQQRLLIQNSAQSSILRQSKIQIVAVVSWGSNHEEIIQNSSVSQLLDQCLKRSWVRLLRESSLPYGFENIWNSPLNLFTLS
jgi:hypothetical protein